METTPKPLDGDRVIGYRLYGGVSGDTHIDDHDYHVAFGILDPGCAACHPERRFDTIPRIEWLSRHLRFVDASCDVRGGRLDRLVGFALSRLLGHRRDQLVRARRRN
jgi:hypothetical protein